MDKQIYFWAHMLDGAFNKDIAETELLAEGDHWPEDYFKKLVNKIKSSKFVSYYQGDEFAVKTDAANFIKDFDNHAYIVGYDDDPKNPDNEGKTTEQIESEKKQASTHRFSNTLTSYFNLVVGWFLEEASKNVQAYQTFLEAKLPEIVQFLKDLETDRIKEKELRPKIKQMTLLDFEEMMDEYGKQKANDEASKLSQQLFSSNSKKYDVIKITSYEQMHELFGGPKTGNPKDENSFWCHTNGKNTYDTWINKGAGSNVFFVIASKDWKQQRYPVNPTNALDLYGSSLCAILVSSTGELVNSTLRYNHKCEVAGRTADSAFADWADLNQFYQQDIRSEVLAQMKAEINKAKNEEKAVRAQLDQILSNTSKINESTIPEDLKKKITNIIIPDSVTSIGDNAFEQCESLKSIIIPGSVTSIGYEAFAECRSLKSIIIPGSVTSIEYEAFARCESLTSITIPNSVTSIGYATFARCESLTSIIIPSSVTNIGDNAFYWCKSLKSINIPDSVTSISYGTFDGCKSLSSISIPNSVTSIGNWAFAQCESLKSIIIPSSVTSIGYDAFHWCKSLTSITIPNSVASIGNGAFHWCKLLKSITIPSSVTNIGYMVFAECRSLKSIIVPNQKTADAVLENNPEVEDKIVIKSVNESKRHSRRQILEAIAYWERQLEN